MTMSSLRVAQFIETNPAEYAWLVAKSPIFSFASSVLSALHRYGDLTPNQLAAVQRCVAKDSAPRPAPVPAAEVDVAPIHVAFDNAKNSGLMYPKLRLGAFVFSPAPVTGKNAGAIYVKSEGVYLGKVVGGKLFTSRDASQDNVTQMTEVLADPRSAAIAYGKTFGKCSVCNKDLSDPESVAQGIGPICAKRFGWQASV
jgi:hypothetical protein